MLNIRTAIVLVVFVFIITLTARTVTVAGVLKQSANVGDQLYRERTEKSECASLPSHYSLHNEYIQGTGRWIPFTEAGPTGVDGGLIQLLSSYRICSGS